MYQLPDDVVSTGFKQTAKYTFEQVFYSKKYDFEGTEKEFVEAGFGYKFEQIGEFKRLVLSET